VTPFQVAKAECANCDSAGNCAGVGIADDLSCYMFRRPGKCWLALDEQGQIKRCPYFEDCVAPLANKRAQADSTQDQRKAAARLAEGVRKYEMAVLPAQTTKYAKCKDCKSNVIAPKRLCPKCAKRRKLQSTNASRKKNGAFRVLVANDL
jgi:hypothetical protein